MWITKAKYLDHPIQQLSLVSTIIPHYPLSLAIAIRRRVPKTTGELIAVLTEFENTTSFCEQPQSEQRHNNKHQNVQHQYNKRQDDQPSYNHTRENGNSPQYCV